MTTRSLFRIGAFILTGQVLVALVGVVSLRLFTECAPAAVFGRSNLILSALALGMQLFVAGFTSAQLRYYSEASGKGIGAEFVRDTMRWALRSTAVLATLIALGSAVARAMGNSEYGIGVTSIAIVWLCATAVRNVLMSKIQAQRRQVAYARFQVVEALLLLACTLTALRISATVESYLLGQTIAVAVLVVVLLMSERSLDTFLGKQSPENSRQWRKAWVYGAPFAPMSFLTWLANLGDRYTLAYLLGAEATGRYVASFSIASRGMTLANSALCDLYRPILFDAENRQDTQYARRIFAIWFVTSVALSCVGLVVVFVAGGLISRLLLAPAYRDGSLQIMLWVSSGYAVSGIMQIIENRLLSLGHSARLLLPMVIGAVTNVLFSFWFIGRNGLIGAAQATCASFVLQCLVTTAFLWHALRARAARIAGERPIELA